MCQEEADYRVLQMSAWRKRSKRGFVVLESLQALVRDLLQSVRSWSSFSLQIATSGIVHLAGQPLYACTCLAPHCDAFITRVPRVAWRTLAKFLWRSSVKFDISLSAAVTSSHNF